MKKCSVKKIMTVAACGMALALAPLSANFFDGEYAQKRAAAEAAARAGQIDSARVAYRQALDLITREMVSGNGTDFRRLLSEQTALTAAAVQLNGRNQAAAPVAQAAVVPAAHVAGGDDLRSRMDAFLNNQAPVAAPVQSIESQRVFWVIATLFGDDLNNLDREDQIITGLIIENFKQRSAVFRELVAKIGRLDVQHMDKPFESIGEIALQIAQSNKIQITENEKLLMQLIMLKLDKTERGDVVQERLKEIRTALKKGLDVAVDRLLRSFRNT